MKEIIISLLIIMSITIGNNLTQDYTKNAVEETSNMLNSLKEDSLQEKEIQELQQKIDEILSKWEEKNKKLAYYIEHDELEKVKVNLMSIKGYLEIDEEDEISSKVEETIFILKHIEEKNKFSLENVF